MGLRVSFQGDGNILTLDHDNGYTNQNIRKSTELYHLKGEFYAMKILSQCKNEERVIINSFTYIQNTYDLTISKSLHLHQDWYVKHTLCSMGIFCDLCLELEI